MNVAVIGDFDSARLTHKATNTALHHSAEALSMDCSIEWLRTSSLGTEVDITALQKYHGIFCAPGGSYDNMAGALEAIRFAREYGRPFIGT